MKYKVYIKSLSIFIIIMCLINIVPVSAVAEFYKPEVQKIGVVYGTPIRTMYVQTIITTDTKPIPDFKEYICIFGADNRLKSVTKIKPTADVTKTFIKVDYDIDEDYIRLFLWDDDMKPYSDGEPIPLKYIKKTTIHVDGAMSGGYGSGSISGKANN